MRERHGSMERPILVFLVGLCAIFGLACLLMPRPNPYGAKVQEGTLGPVVSDSMLITDQLYGISVDDSVEYAEGTISWFIQREDEPSPRYRMSDNAIEESFQVPGKYVVRAYQDLRELAVDTLLVGLGESFNVRWPDDPEFIIGSTVSVTDLSTRVDSRTWKVTHAESTLDLPFKKPEVLEWEPADTGLFEIRIEVKLGSGKVRRDQHTIRVVAAPAEPVPQVILVVPPPTPRPKKDAVAKKPKEEHKEPSSNSPECFVTGNKLEGSTFLIKVEKPPRDQVKFEDEATVFKISPKYDCMFTGFEYFSNGKIDDLEIKIECLNRLCVGTATYPFKRKGGYDAHDAVRIDFTNLPILNKDFEYRITVKAKSPGMLGFFPIQSNVFKPEKQGNTFRMGEASISFADLKTCIFNLRFVR
jgi:hypothetical protein